MVMYRTVKLFRTESKVWRNYRFYCQRWRCPCAWLSTTILRRKRKWSYSVRYFTLCTRWR